MRRCRLTVLVIAVCTSISYADPPPPTAKLPITLPGGIVIGAPLPKSDPSTVPAEKYRELQDRLDRLQAIVDAAQPVRPRACELEGKIEQRGRQSVVRLKANFKVTTTRPDTVVYLGCQKAHAIEARGDDGKAPLLMAGDDGLRVQLPTAGEHSIRLELDLPVTPRGPKGADLGFEIGLPGAAITALSFEPLANVKQYTLTTRLPKGAIGAGQADSEVEQVEADRFVPGKGGTPLGPIASLVMTWEDPTRKADVVRSAEGDITVTVGADDLTTEARLRLRGPAAEWRFTAPATADVTVGPWVNPASGKAPSEAPAGRAPNVIRPEPGQSIWRVETRESAAGDLLATIVIRTPRGRDAAGRVPFNVGPFAVLDVPQQAGIIRVRTPLTVKASVAVRGDCRRESDDGVGESIFRYRYPALKTSPTEPPIIITLAPAVGVIHSRVRNTLRLTEGGWRLKAEVSLSPSRAEVEEVSVELPDGFRLTDVEPREIVEQFTLDRANGPRPAVARVRLSGPRRTSFTFTMLGEYGSGSSAATASFGLPRVLGVVSRGSEVLVEVTAGREVRGTFRVWEEGRVGTWETTLESDATENGGRLRGSVDGAAARIDLQLQQPIVGVRTRMEADVDIGLNRVQIAERLSLRFTGRLPTRLRLKAGVIINDLRTSRGIVERVDDGWELILPTDGDREPEFFLSYSFAAPATGANFAVPLLEPEAGGTSRLVRIWTSTFAVRLSEPSDWRVAPIEVAGSRRTLPELTLQTDGPTSPLVVLLAARPAVTDAGPSIELVQAEARLGDQIDYRVRFVLRDCASGAAFSLPLGAHDPEVFAQGKRLPDSALVGDAPTIVRIPPLLVGRDRVVIEMRYRLAGRWLDRLQTPLPMRGELVGDVTWTVVPRPGQIALSAGDAVNAWNPRRLLSAIGVPMGDAGVETTLVIREPQLRPLPVVHAPRFGWVLGWSLAVGVGAVGLAFAGRRLRWIVVGGLLALGMVSTFVWPQPLALAVVAALPGVLGFVVLAFGYRVIQAQYRRRLTRFPGFARAGSSLVRPSVVRTAEPSKNGSSAAHMGTPATP